MAVIIGGTQLRIGYRRYSENCVAEYRSRTPVEDNEVVSDQVRVLEVSAVLDKVKNTDSKKDIVE